MRRRVAQRRPRVAWLRFPPAQGWWCRGLMGMHGLALPGFVDRQIRRISSPMDCVFRWFFFSADALTIDLPCDVWSSENSGAVFQSV